jgi:hypothetical protein
MSAGAKRGKLRPNPPLASSRKRAKKRK